MVQHGRQSRRFIHADAHVACGKMYTPSTLVRCRAIAIGAIRESNSRRPGTGGTPKRCADEPSQRSASITTTRPMPSRRPRDRQVRNRRAGTAAVHGCEEQHGAPSPPELGRDAVGEPAKLPGRGMLGLMISNQLWTPAD